MFVDRCLVQERLEEAEIVYQIASVVVRTRTRWSGIWCGSRRWRRAISAKQQEARERIHLSRTERKEQPGTRCVLLEAYRRSATCLPTRRVGRLARLEPGGNW